ncbi:electron transport complex subunit RsxC [Reinekea marinisedimentorum]|uniref:Ion-translocating oxidoreductase complex subunit C n=1 Tax=Reinekea marinisedimentorum TaxID=230495 RepID=A0A4V2UJ68_9GAMM|nr:electron transport complex subunit RsxC [Reinekea marinisedimentorum]TCS38880.1 electron transport complex protein RnfC [Reinekea marinisedimentorum]
MQTLFAKPFRGGIHPTGHKERTEQSQIEKLPTPKRIFLGLQQRNGTLLTPLVKVGDYVGKGQLVAKGASDMAVPLHSPVNGTVVEIRDYVSAHPSGIKIKTLIIKSSEDNSWSENYPPINPDTLSQDEMIQRILDAGIVGLGGAGFPSGVKLRLAKQKGVHTLLINGGECEPYLTCDDRLMQEHASEVVAGIELMVRAIGAKEALVAVEDNKPRSIEALSHAASEIENISVKVVPSLYPMGSERHLIKAVTGKTVAPGELSVALGILVHNVATARAVYHALRFNRPLIERVITVSGGGIEQPKNLVVPIGTPVSDLLTACGGLTMSAQRLVAGGPMMGQVIPSPYTPVDKSIGGLLALNEQEVRDDQSHDCLRCGRCVSACPMGLMPFQMAAHSRVSDYEGAQDYGLNNCLLCGACSYVCPSRIPLVQHFSHARGQINAQRSMAQKSALARKLTDARKQRLDREAAAKQAEKEAKAAARKKKAAEKKAKQAAAKAAAGE